MRRTVMRLLLYSQKNKIQLMKNKILPLILFFPVALFAQQFHHSGYSDWLNTQLVSGNNQFQENGPIGTLRDVSYLLRGTRRDTFDLQNSVFNVTDSAEYLYNLDTTLNRYVQLIHDVDSGW